MSRAIVWAGLLLACTPDRPPLLPEPESDPSALHVEPGAETPAEINANYDHHRLEEWKRILGAETREVVARREQILDALELPPGAHVADVGAGTGAFTFDLAARVGPNGLVYAVEVQADFLAELREMVAARESDNVVVVAADQSSVGLLPASIDLAFVCDVYHHLERPADTMTGIAHALRPGGRLVVVDLSRAGTKDPFVLRHVRAGPEVFRAEIEAAGFRFERELDLLEENFFFVFVRE